MTSGAKIAKNAAWLMGATTAQKLVAFVAFTLVARFLGAELTGVYFYSISITSIFVIFSELGITPVVIRAVAGAREDASRLLGAAFWLKLFLAPFAIIAALAYAVAFGADAMTLTTVAIACVVMTADTFHLVMYGALRGRQQLKPESFGMFVGQVLTAIVAIYAAWAGLGPVWLAVALLVGSTWNVVWAYHSMRQSDLSIGVPRRADYLTLIREATPFGIAGIAVKVYSYVDSLFIQRYYGPTHVGYYAVAYKLTYAIQFLPITFTAALYPALAAASAAKNETELRKTFTGSLQLMAAIGFPVAAGLSALAPKIIPLFYGSAFDQSVTVMRILPWVLLPIFMDFPIGALLNASHRAHLKTTAMVSTMVINILLNALLVPLYGPVGAAWAGVGSFWMLFAIGAWFTRHDAGGLLFAVTLTGRGLVAAATSWVAWFVIGGPMPLLPAAVFGGAVAVVMAFLLGFVTVDDVLGAWAQFRRRSRRQNGGEPPHD